MTVAPSLPIFAPSRWRDFVVSERLTLALFVCAAVVVRTIAVFHYQIDSDEPQHLHVVWGWAHGYLQYRDVFDNHMPLFQILFAPLLRIVGERADALIAMRLAMLPLYAATVALTFRIAISCYQRGTAIWGTMIAALFPLFLLCSTEFRTDDLWTVFWLGSIATLVCAPLTTLRAAAAGFLLGLAAAVSAKTSLLLLSVVVGAICARFVRRKRFIAAFFACVSVPPAAVAIYFASRGAWSPFVYAVITHNVVPHLHPARLIIFPILLLTIALLVRHAETPQQVFLFVTTHFYGAALYCLWPLVEHEHWLPYFPLAAITLLPMFFTYRRAVFIALAEIVITIGVGHLYRDDTHDGLAIIEQTLQLTAPGEFVMDLKGETAFRPRAFYYVLEPMTKHRIRDGRIRDTIVADILRTRTMVVSLDHYGFPRATRNFLRRNFVAIGAVRVPGHILLRGQSTFRIDVPAEYAIIGRSDEFTGLLDGRPYAGPRVLVAGVHTVTAPPSDASYAVLWSRAAGRGFTPFGVVQKRPGRHHRHRNRPACNPGAGCT